MYEDRMEGHLEDQQENGEPETHDWEPGGADGICIHCNLDERSGDHTEKFCYYCAEPLENGLCSAYCHGSEDDEGRDCEDIDE